jgi:hypothetical protein
LGWISELEQRRTDLTHNRIVGLLEAGELEQADAVLGQASSQSTLGQKDWTELSVFVVQKRAEAALKAEGYPAAIGIVAEGLARLGRNQILLKTYEAYVHNQFAVFFNARKYEEARSILSAGLNVYPGSGTFSQDMKTVDKAVQR